MPYLFSFGKFLHRKKSLLFYRIFHINYGGLIMKILKFETNIWKDENITDPIGNFVNIMP